MASSAQKTKQTHGPWLWPLILVIVGVILLLDNFLLLGDFEAWKLLPLLLVIAGAQVLLRGDLLPSSESHTFGITRGSVESATLEISSGEIDVDIRPLQREERLIAGQYAANSRPYLQVQDNYAHLKMERRRTPWYSFSDWHVSLAHNLPWQVLISSWLGQAHLDLSDLIIQDLVVGTGFGEIRLIAPPEALGEIYLQSALGNIFVTTPDGYNTQIITEGGWLFRVHHDEDRYENPEPNTYVATDAAEDAPLVVIRIRGTFGDAYLS